MKTKKQRNGFSLLELLAVVTILGIIAAMIVPRVTTSTTTAKTQVDAANRAEINAAVERFYINTGDWPADDMSDMDNAGADATPDYFPEGLPVNPLAPSTPYELDSTTHRVKD